MAANGRYICAIGAVIVGASIILISIPALISLSGAAKYVVAFSMVGLFIGLGVMFNGAIDWWRGR